MILDTGRWHQRIPRLAAWSLGVAITATIGANLAPPSSALVSAWPAPALVGSQ